MKQFAAALLAATLIFGACTRVQTGTVSGRHAWTRPGVLRIADISDPDRFNPLLSTMDLVEDLSSLVFSYLVIADDRGRLVGDLATEVPTLRNGGISRDGKTYVYHLRRSVRWHDGAPFTAGDVKFTWQVVVNHDNNVLHREGYDRVASIDTPDDYTVVVHLRNRYPPFVSKFFTTLQEGSKGILPRHLLATLPNINQAAFNAKPVGTGPFAFVSWERGRRIVLTANAHYFKGRPKLNRIVLEVIPDDNAILNAVRAHSIDLVVSVPSTLFEEYRKIPEVTAQLKPWNAETIFAINNGKPGLRHIEVRRAIAAAIDYDTLIGKISHGVGTTAHDIVPPMAIGYTANPPYRYDPDGANRLLDAGGWKRGSDGVRAKGSERLDFTMTVSTGGATARAIAVEMQQWFHAIGINLAIRSYPYNIIFAPSGPIYTFKYDFATYSYTLPYDPDNLFYLGCRQIYPQGENVYRYCDPKVDAAENAGLSTDDPLQRARFYRIAEREIHDTIPYIPLYVLRRPVAYNVDLKNFKTAPSIAPWFNAWQWQI